MRKIQLKFSPGRFIHCSRCYIAFLHRESWGTGTGVTAHAYSGTDSRFCLWMALWFGGWSRDTLSQQLYDRNAAHTHGYDNDL